MLAPVSQLISVMSATGGFGVILCEASVLAGCCGNQVQLCISVVSGSGCISSHVSLWLSSRRDQPDLIGYTTNNKNLMWRYNCADFSSGSKLRRCETRFQYGLSPLDTGQLDTDDIMEDGVVHRGRHKALRLLRG